MARIVWPAFAGMVPRIEPRNLEAPYAVAASGARLERGNLSPWRGTSALHTFGSAVDSFTRHAGTWLGWAGDVDARPGPTKTDRLYITGDGAPKLRVAGSTYALALPAPATKPNVSHASGTVDPDLAETVRYCYTWVTSLDEESAPSPLSDPIVTSVGAAVRVNGLATTPPNRLIDRQRIYRTQTSASGATDLFFAAEIAATLKTYDHDPELAQLVEPLPSIGYGTPPATMAGLIEMANGIFAAFDGHELLFSEPYRPHAWPPAYRIYVSDNIVALAAFGSSLAVLTDGRPSIAQGLEPGAIAVARSEESYPCVAKRGVVDLGYACAFPSTHGLVTIAEGAGARLVTEPLFTREQWDALAPETFIAARLGPRYVFSHIPRGEATRRLGIIDLSGQQPFYMTHQVAARGLRYNEGAGRLEALLANGTSLVVVDDLAAAHGTYLWRSKPMLMPARMAFGCILAEGRTIAASPAHTLRVIADGAAIHTITGGLNAIHRLPPVKAKEWAIEVEGNAEVTQVTLAGSPSEIAGG